MNQKITIQDIADMAGVAKSTVSRYLNNGYVSKEKAALIDRVIKNTGYKSNFFAQRLKTKNSRLIGIVMPRLDSSSAGKLLAGFNLILQQLDYQVLILVSDLQVQKEVANIRQLIQQGVDGIIVQSIAITDEHLNIVKNSPVPIIFTGQSHDDVTYLKINDKQAGHIMGTYIAQLNHQNVVYLGVSPRDVAVGFMRRQGFIDGFTAAAPHGTVHFVETDFSFELAYTKGVEVLSYKPTAVVCATDNIALGLLRYLHEKNIQVPQEISLAGFGGYPYSNISYPSLTTMAFDYKHLGAKTAEKLLMMFKGMEVKSEFDDNMIFITQESTQKI
ncbi:LacI family DNA-binding transcriptional regulator [Megamonas hypermegale]|uniref:LacI family DNA-binding transcriptional regulator n=1 Tax=Megamonas hypermegale TaxID=158847 RepID=UPI0026EF2A49|nr:LacI family DNA-binding transcriptional regulator [Megamonas hypermegale]